MLSKQRSLLDPRIILLTESKQRILHDQGQTQILPGPTRFIIATTLGVLVTLTTGLIFPMFSSLCTHQFLQPDSRRMMMIHSPPCPSSSFLSYVKVEVGKRCDDIWRSLHSTDFISSKISLCLNCSIVYKESEKSWDRWCHLCNIC